jgi:hypothetical protein
LAQPRRPCSSGPSERRIESPDGPNRGLWRRIRPAASLRRFSNSNRRSWPFQPASMPRHRFEADRRNKGGLGCTATRHNIWYRVIRTPEWAPWAKRAPAERGQTSTRVRLIVYLRS